MKAINLGIVGATGMVGRKLLDLLAKRDFPINKLSLFGKSTVGESVSVSYTHLTLPTKA